MVNVHTLCHYTMLCYALQRAVPELSFLAKPRQFSGHDDQMVLVDKLDTPTTHWASIAWAQPRAAYDYDYNHDHGPDSHSPDSHGLSSHNPDLMPHSFIHVGYSSTT